MEAASAHRVSCCCGMTSLLCFIFQEFSENIARENDWPVLPSPMIWRELVDRGGKGTLIGGARDFQEYANTYYAQLSKFTTYDLQDIVADNKRYKAEDVAIARSYKPDHAPPKIVAILGAESAVATHLLMLLSLRTDVVDPENKIDIRLMAGQPNAKGVEDLCEATEDVACSGINSIRVDYSHGSLLQGADVVIVLDVVPRRRSEPRKDWLARRYAFLFDLGERISEMCPHTVKVLVGGSLHLFEGSESVAAPINFDVQTLYVACSPLIPARNIVGLVRH